MKYAVDRIENDIVVLENLSNGNILNVNKCNLPANIKEKDVLIYENNAFKISEEEKKNRIETINEKMERLKNNG